MPFTFAWHKIKATSAGSNFVYNRSNFIALLVFVSSEKSRYRHIRTALFISNLTNSLKATVHIYRSVPREGSFHPRSRNNRRRVYVNRATGKAKSLFNLPRKVKQRIV